MEKKIFEISWEVANKVGGIYTVLSSKAPYAKSLSNEYYFIGPYLSENLNPDFEEKEIPLEFKEISNFLTSKNIILHYGIWKITNSPAFLIDSRKLMENKNNIKTELWNDYKIDSLFSGFDFEEPAVWGYAVGMFLEEISKKSNTVGIFHEWMTGSAILYLKKRKANIATIFTTHATVIGRAMACSKEILEKNLDVEKEAINRGVQAKHSLEKQSALNAEIFTTVSERTAKECRIAFGIYPDIITINGLDMRSINTGSILEKSKLSRNKLNDIIKSYFKDYYNITQDKSFLCFISGRCEVNSKGIDVFIKSLGKINKSFENKNQKEIFAFILIPASHGPEDPEILNNLKSLNKNKKLKNIPFRKDLPRISTHYNSDQYIMDLLLKEGLNNKKENLVKVIFCPLYLSKEDGYWNTEYYDFIRGFDLGVFPSFYEPWGYTPAECISLGIPAITTDLAGFGLYCKKNYKKEDNAISILNREYINEEDFTEELKNSILNYYKLDKKKITKIKESSHEFSKELSWEHLITNYEIAIEKAIHRKKN